MRRDGPTLATAQLFWGEVARWRRATSQSVRLEASEKIRPMTARCEKDLRGRSDEAEMNSPRGQDSALVANCKRRDLAGAQCTCVGDLVSSASAQWPGRRLGGFTPKLVAFGSNRDSGCYQLRIWASWASEDGK